MSEFFDKRGGRALQICKTVSAYNAFIVEAKKGFDPVTGNSLVPPFIYEAGVAPEPEA